MHVPFPWEALDRLPRHPDWKYEYWDGELHLSHRPWPIEVRRPVGEPVALPPRAPPVRLLRPDEDEVPLRSFLRDIWWDEPPYVTYDEELRRRVLDDEVRRARWPAADAPGAVAEVDGELVGALLTTSRGRDDDTLILSWLTVAFEHRECGAATAMLAVLLSELGRLGEEQVGSAFSIANEPSLRWHLRQGFRIVPDHLRRGWRPPGKSALVERDSGEGKP